MTEPRDAASALPLSVTCPPDDRFADAVRALVGRVGAVGGDADHALPFVSAVEQVMAWLFAHPRAVDGDVVMHFDRQGDCLSGRLRWTASGDAPMLPDAVAVASPDVHVACDPEGSDVLCRVSCRC